MLVLVTGGAASGKSEVAERIALALPGPHWYAAAMMRGGAEAGVRIARHRAMRAGKGFRTLELQDSPALPQGGTLLLEDLGNLLANGWEGRLPDMLACENAVVVGNEVGADGVRYRGFTAGYVKRLGALACQVAARADAVVEVVAGVPCLVKGDLREVAPWVS